MKNVSLCSRILGILVFVSVFIISGFSTSNVFATTPVPICGDSGNVCVTDISASQTFAEADNTFEHGWRWVFDVTVPNDEPILKMKFADWVKGSDKIFAANNIRFWSQQSSNAFSTSSAILITASSTYSSSMNLNKSIDLDTSKNGRQIQIVVEVKVPENSPGGSYSTSYGIQTERDTIKPVITLLGNDSMTVDAGSTYIDAGATAMDNIDGNITNLIVVEGIPISPVVHGDYTITYNINDSAGNHADQVERTVHVNNKIHAEITLSNLDQTYNGTTKSVTVTTIPADLNTIVTYNGLTTLPIDAGTYHVIATIDDPRYSGSTTTDMIINQAVATVTAIGIDKVYDGTRNASTTLEVIGAVHGDELTAKDTATFANKNVGNWEVTVTGIILEGEKAGNYSYNTTATTIAEITARPLVLTVTGINKEYDGNDTATFSSSTDKINGDILNIHYGTATFGDENIGNNKEITITNVTIDGVDSINYSPLDFGTLTTHANITQKLLTATITADSKDYDGNDSAEADCLLTGKIGSEDVTCSVDNAKFNNKDAGNGKTVNADINLDGNDKGNYTVNPTATTHANINKLILTASITADDKTYNGNDNAIASCAITSGTIIGTETVGCEATNAKFDSRNAGDNITVTANVGLTGNNSINYELSNSSDTDIANINKLAIDVTAQSDTKIYDGTVTSSLPPIISPQLVVGDTATVSQVFNSSDAGDNKTLTPSIEFTNVTLATNYNVSLNTAIGEITKANQTITVDQASIPNGPIPDNFFTLRASASSMLPVTFSGGGNGVCNVDTNGLITILNTGSCSVTMTQSGNNNYYPALIGNQNFTVRFNVTVSQ